MLCDTAGDGASPSLEPRAITHPSDRAESDAAGEEMPDPADGDNRSAAAALRARLLGKGSKATSSALPGNGKSAGRQKVTFSSFQPLN